MAQNDETIFRPQEVVEENNENKNAAKTKKGSWKKVTIGGIAAIMVGAAASAYAESADSSDAEGADGASSHDGGHTAPRFDLPGETKMAEGITDEMSFGEAFKTARQEVGTGGVFQWKGGQYSTFTEDEWNGLSDADKNTYAHRVSSIEKDTETVPEPEPVLEDPIEEPIEGDDDGGDDEILDVKADTAESEEEDVRFLGDASEEDLADDAVVEVEEDAVDVDLTQNLTTEEQAEDVTLEDLGASVADTGVDDSFKESTLELTEEIGSDDIPDTDNGIII